MARNLRCNKLGILTLFLAAASFAVATPAVARDADDAFGPLQTTAAMTDIMFVVRPQSRPDVMPTTVQVSRAVTATPMVIRAPETVDHGRIRQTWSIGVFR